ncbi:MAG: hypothetical protein ACREFX_01845, partial [Opitutaceae bacterium]
VLKRPRLYDVAETVRTAARRPCKSGGLKAVYQSTAGSGHKGAGGFGRRPCWVLIDVDDQAWGSA